MKQLIKIGLLCSAFLLAGCEDIPGQLTVVKGFNALIKGKTKAVEAGQYKTALNFKKNSVIATVETSNGNFKINLNVPDNSQIPSNGNFELTSAQSGQPFDVVGSVETKVTETPRQSGYESCQYQSYQNVCDQHGCHTVPVTRMGNHYVDFYYRDTNQKMQFNIAPVGDVQTKLASFSGEARYSQKIILNEGQCF